MLPTGTVALLATDLEDSAELARRMGDDYAAVLLEHQRLVRETAEQFGGREVDCRDDEFLLVFERTRDAVAAAAELQRELTAHDWPHGQVCGCARPCTSGADLGRGRLRGT